MKKQNKVHPLTSQAFALWLVKIRYRAVLIHGCIKFYCAVSNKNFPRDVMILENGKLNKPAMQLFKEFMGYEPFEGVA